MAYMSVLSWMVVVAPPPLRGVLCRTRDLSKWILHPRKFGTFQWHVLNVLGQNLEFQLLNSNSLSPWHAICKIQPHLGFSEQNNGESPNNRWFKALFSPLYKMTVNRGQLPMFQTTPKFCQATAHALSWWQAAGPGGPRTTPSTEMHCRNYEAGYWIL